MDTQTTIPETEVPPKWIKKILKRHGQLNKRYETAYAHLGAAWNTFLSRIDEINAEHGTTFTVDQAMLEFQGQETFVDDSLIGDDDDD